MQSHKNREVESDLLRSIKEQLVNERRKKYELLLKLKGDFVKVNAQNQQEKAERD